MLVLILTSACIILVYRYITRNHDYWAKRNVKHDPPLPLFGNHLKNVLVMRTTPDIGTEMLNKYKGEKLVGYYRGTSPVLIIKDPEIVKRILTIDCKSFHDRGWNENTTKQPLSQNLLFAKPELCRMIKQQLTPGFTLHKLRTMSPQILDCVGKLEKAIEEIASHNKTVTAYDLMVGYTIRCIGACGFGIALTEQSLFTNLMKKFFVKSTPQVFLQASLETFPGISVLGNYIKIIDKDLEDIIMEMTRDLIDARSVNPSLDKDFLDIFFETTKRKNEQSAKLSADKKEKADLQFIAAQLFFFVFAGFESTAMSMSTSLHQLAYHPEIQSEVQKEIDMALSKHDNKLMECIDDMPLLGMVFKETMRLCSPFGALRRVCAEKYTIPDSDITIDPGVGILIPIQAIHNDPEFYENPEEFRPRRFATKSREEYTYLAFGHGPKKCIGYKLAVMMVLAGLSAILHRFTVVPGEGSDPRIKFKKTSFIAQIVEGGLPVNFILRK